jgi:hypothetical protein
MKLRLSLLVLACLPTFFTSPAFATKAKLAALQGARFLTDSQLVFQNPAQINHLDNYLTFELGGTSSTSNPKSEGGLFKDMFGGRGGVYLGHMSDDQLAFRAINGFLVEENPVEFFYGKDTWGASVGISNSDKKTTDEEQRSIVARFGIDTGIMEAWANLEIISKSDKVNDEYRGAPIATVGGEYHMDNNLYVVGSAKYGKIENRIGGVNTDTDIAGAEVGILDRSIKNEKASIYYGPKLRWAEVKFGSQKLTVYDLPLYIGMEYNAFSWLVARASVSQNVILGSTKDERVAAPGNKANSISNNTTVATGIGINWNSLMIDATFAGSTTGDLNGNSILANLGVIYNF